MNQPRMSCGLECLCTSCEKLFYLGEDKKGVVDEQGNVFPSADLEMRGCESGGIYEVTVTCPYCGWMHNVY